MKILHLIYDHVRNPWVGGGGAIRCYEIYRRLAEKGHQITIVSGNFPGAFNYREGNLEFVFVGSDKNYILSTLSYAFKAHGFLKDNIHNYDVIIEDFAPWNPIFSYRYQKNHNVILQIQLKEGKNILKKYKFFGLPFYFIEVTYPPKYENIIVVSEHLKHIYGKNAVVISNGVDKEYLKESFIIGGNYILYIGRIDFYSKGLDFIVQVAKDINIPIIIAGRGKDEKRLSKIIKKYKNLKYIGEVYGEKKIKLIKKSKFVIMPSRYEAQGIVALEAAALGKPVLVSNIPVFSYVVENKFGISFRSGDIEDMKEKIKYLFYNEVLLREMGENGKVFAKNFTWDKIAEQYEKYLYEKVTSSKNYA